MLFLATRFSSRLGRNTVHLCTKKERTVPMSHCHCDTLERRFDIQQVRRELTEYHYHGAAKATRSVSTGTGEIACGFSDIGLLLLALPGQFVLRFLTSLSLDRQLPRDSPVVSRLRKSHVMVFLTYILTLLKYKHTINTFDNRSVEMFNVETQLRKGVNSYAEYNHGQPGTQISLPQPDITTHSIYRCCPSSRTRECSFSHFAL